MNDETERSWHTRQAESDYRRAVQELATAFQLIEAGLRACVGSAYSMIAIRTRDVLRFRLGPKSLQKDALGTLIRKFSTHFSAEDLVKELERLAPIRNHVAHEALLMYASDEPFDLHYIARERARIQKCTKEAIACYKMLAEHMTRTGELVQVELDKLEAADRRQLDLLE